MTRVKAGQEVSVHQRQRVSRIFVHNSPICLAEALTGWAADYPLRSELGAPEFIKSGQVQLADIAAMRYFCQPIMVIRFYAIELFVEGQSDLKASVFETKI